MTCEPLCGVYNLEQTRASIARSVITQRMACKRMLALLKDVRCVPVSELRAIDPTMLSLHNIDTPQDYEDMNARCQLAFVYSTRGRKKRLLDKLLRLTISRLF
ncbi:MAG TPA: hypothetical protein VFF30_06125 [Nitrososphaerales archaeon]|nr:hypothetical protein [Nitrososphaerales archaeon]